MDAGCWHTERMLDRFPIACILLLSEGPRIEALTHMLRQRLIETRNVQAVVLVVCVALNSSLLAAPMAPAETGTVFGKFDAWRGTPIVVGPRSSRAAWQRLNGRQFQVVVDGVPGPLFDRIDGLTFSADDSRFLYIGYSGDHATLVIDGKIGRSYQDVHDPLFSIDSRHVMYVARVPDDKEVLVVDGSETTSYRYIRSPVFSSTGEIAIDGLKGLTEDNHVLVRNGVESAKGGPLSDLTFSPDGKHLAAVRREDDGGHLMFDGVEGPVCGIVGDIIFSPDGKRIAYTAMNRDRSLMEVVDGKPNGPYVSIMRVIFSPDSRRFVTTAITKTGSEAGGIQWTQVIDGKEVGPFRNVGGASFSPDGSHLAFFITRDTHSTMWVDGREEMAFEQGGLTRFSPDSRHLAYEVTYSQKFGGVGQAIVLDGKAGVRFEGVIGLTFSPDSRRLAYCALRRRADTSIGSCVVLDGVEGKSYVQVAEPVFSPDSRHCAYLASLGRQSFAVVDDHETRAMDQVLGQSKLVFDAGQTFHFLAVEAGNLVRVTVNLPAR